MNKIYVIGGGISGLVAACYLRRNNYNVCIIEKNDVVGGRLFEFKEKGFRFNNGPSWYWMKDIFEKVFEEIGIKNDDMYKLIKLDPQYKIVFENNDLPIPGNYTEINKMFKSDNPKFDNFINRSSFKYKISVDQFLKYNNLSFTEYINRKTLKHFLKLDLLTSYRKYSKKITLDKNLQKLIEWPSLFIGSSPKKVSAMYSLLSYSMLKDGTYIPENGMIEIINSLEKHCKKLGVEIKLNESVLDYEIKDNQIISIKTNKNNYNNIESVLSACDYKFTESLLPEKYKTYPDRFWNKLELCPSALLIHLGINKKIATKDLFHILFFENDLDVHIDTIYNKKELPEKPLFYINITSSILDSAPENCENLFILIPTGPHKNIDEKYITKYYNYVLDRLELYFNTNIRDSIIVKKIFRDQNFTDRFNSFGGNAYGLTCHPLQTAFLKPRIKSRYINNLFYCGQLTNPGPGLPPCAISGLNTAKYIIKNKNKLNRFNLGESSTLILAIFLRTLAIKTTIKSILKEFLFMIKK